MTARVFFQGQAAREVVHRRVDPQLVAGPVHAVALHAVQAVDAAPGPRRRSLLVGWYLDHRADPRHAVPVDVHDAGVGVDRRPAPLAAAVEAGEDDGALAARGDELPVAAHPPQAVEHVTVRLGRDVGHLVLGHPLPGERGRPHRQGLGGPGDLAGNVRGRERPFLDGVDRLAGLAVEHEDVGRLGDLGHDVAPPAVLDDGQQVGGRREVAVPDVVVHRLEMPDPLAGRRVEGEQGVGEEVGAHAVAAVEVGGGRAGGDEHQPPLVVHRHARPVVGGADAEPRVRRPGVVAVLAGMRDGAEDPPDLAGAGVECADVPGGGGVGLGVPRRQDEQVLVDDPRRVRDDEQVRDVAAGVEPVVEVDAAPVAERLDGNPGVGVEGEQLRPRRWRRGGGRRRRPTTSPRG